MGYEINQTSMRTFAGLYEYKYIKDYMTSSKKAKDRRIVVEDEYGYKYDVLCYNFIRNPNLNFVHKGNPYSLENISRWIVLNKKLIYLKENNIYENGKKKLRFKCISCGMDFLCSWFKVLNEHYKSNPCPNCSLSIKVPGAYNSLGYLKPELIKEWDDCNLFSPYSVTRASGKRVVWKCKKCNKNWKARVVDRVCHDNGCPYCKNSKGEMKIRDFLTKNKIAYIQEFSFQDCRNIRPLEFDFYIPRYNVCIEYQGEQHYKVIHGEFFGNQERLRDLQKRDFIKFSYCKNKEIVLIIIPYWDFENIDTILYSFLIGGYNVNYTNTSAKFE